MVGSVAGAAIFSACGSSGSSAVFCPTCPTDGGIGSGGDDGGGGLGDDGSTPPLNVGDSGTVDSADLAITPVSQTINVVTGQTPPTVTFKVTYKGSPVSASFSIADRGELGSVVASTGVFTPAGTLGGTVGITGEYDGATVTGHVTIHLSTVANGDPTAATSASDAGTAGGGYNGVGGDGTGGAISTTSQATLDAASGDGGAAIADTSLAWLYPYDQTVFPRGILPPLLMWNVGAAGDYDSIKIQLTESNYQYTGYFAKPVAATTFKNHPVLSDAWTALYNSNNGNEAVSVDITLAKGASAYKLPTRSWTIANGYLQGTVYYQAYNTQIVKNSDFTVAGGAQVGAATLAIRRGSTSPELIAGTNGSIQGEGCRVCHTVSGDGSTLFTQKTKYENGSDYPNYWQSERFDLKSTPATETSIGPDTGIFAWGALTSDASLLFSNVGGALAGAPDMSGNTMAAAGDKISKLYNTSTGAVVPTTGLPADLQASTPVFSPDGKHVAFNYWAGGAADGGVSVGDTKSLGMADFDGTSAFTNLGIAYTPANGQVVWPSFLPTSDAVVFGLQLVGPYSTTSWNDQYGDGPKPTSELWWYDVATKEAHVLANLNGVGLPVLPAASANTHTSAGDAVLNYEPTVNPVPSGGYAWVVFTSRRIYGNVATLSPYASDPRYDDGVNSLTQPTPKKLWVAAIDLGAPGGSDPSHPAFYLPAQELLGGNSRGYWTVDPCAADGTSCETGDQCCGGYCQQTGDGGALTCSSVKPTCSAEFDKCTTSADCCVAGSSCTNNRCTQSIR